MNQEEIILSQSEYESLLEEVHRLQAEGQTRTMHVDNGTGQEDGSGSGESSKEPLYVCNTNTMKFHYPGCDSVKQMNESNRMNTDLSREELIAQGYQPCGNCRP